MKKVFDELVATEQNPLNLLTLTKNSFSLSQTQFLIAALLDSPRVAKEALLKSGIFRDLFVLDFAMNADELNAFYATIKTLVKPANSAWIDGLAKVSAGILRIPQMTLNGSYCENPVIIQYEQVPHLLKLTPASFKVLYSILGDAALELQAEYFASNKASLQETIYSIMTYPENVRVKFLQLKLDEATILDHCSANPKVLAYVLTNLAPENKNKLLQQKDKLGYNVLERLALLSPEALRDFLANVPKERRFEFMLVHQSLLRYAASSLKVLETVLGYFSPDEVLKLAQQKCASSGNTALYRAALYANDSLKIILASLPAESRLQFVLEENEAGQNVLEYFKGDLLFIEQILASLSLEERRKILYRKNANGQTILHKVAPNLASLRQFLLVCQEENRLEVLLQEDYARQSVLNYTKGDITEILDLIPPASWLRVIKTPDANGQTALHKAANNLSSISELLDLYPENERLGALLTEDNYKRAAVFYAPIDAVSIKCLLERLPAEARLEVLYEKHKSFTCLLYYAPQNLEIFVDILALLPEKDRVQVMQEVQEIYNVAHKAAEDFDLLKKILELLPKKDRLNALCERDNHGLTV
ncbi:MAG: hypothetical protein A3F18_07600 [Legionellales bacterium RIFCSPHIGHO2_12_FULL_37_14]|nr:MAG: hypothetical protein A3F18_07600 [Legionellales bacterium RIFCSPHIGHO2_12_FULL_37_14]